MASLLRLFNTIKYIRLKQGFYRIYYFIKSKLDKRIFNQNVPNILPLTIWNYSFFNKNSFLGPKSFVFLNITHTFKNEIDWNFGAYGKLWTYNLNYFDFLNQEQLSVEQGLNLIHEYLKKDSQLIEGKEPYPISLRGINWIKFLSRNKILDREINQGLYNYYQILADKIEYHLLGNHLLENGFSLFFGAYYFRDDILYKLAIKILINELNEQVLNDGGHFELSPMYHQIILHRLLDCIALVEQNNWKEQEILSFLNKKAESMLSWLRESTFKNGDIPKVNDCAYDIAPTSQELFDYAKQLNIKRSNKVKLKESGYRKYCNDTFELFLDVGDLKPSYQPGHAHSDTFSFELYINQKPFIVDTGTSTYEKNSLRQKERATSAHNTVQIGDFEQSDVWGGFRVGRRAKIISLEENEMMVKAKHNGYKKLGILHERKFITHPKSIIIKDSLSKKTSLPQKAYFHFHPEINYLDIRGNVIIINDAKIIFIGSLLIEKSDYQYAMGFNKTQLALKITVYFNKELETQILL